MARPKSLDKEMIYLKLNDILDTIVVLCVFEYVFVSVCLYFFCPAYFKDVGSCVFLNAK